MLMIHIGLEPITHFKRFRTFCLPHYIVSIVSILSIVSTQVAHGSGLERQLAPYNARANLRKNNANELAL